MKSFAAAALLALVAASLLAQAYAGELSTARAHQCAGRWGEGRGARGGIGGGR